ncbi:uncharacterized protein LOC110189393 isoform X2 [Drosophila serrata]|uniref:uncharacterized protein LOC110189393 isoform X2 n=1 Tax=Drosophila serrata TaxID=7274 RepID=UPI000A1D3359|nr:uncharacterized protein LOC110189393 isoform X2 [Drosophila serrata]
MLLHSPPQFGTLLTILFSVAYGDFLPGSFNLSLYRQMPALYQLDDYDLCLDNTSGSYCLAYVEIEPNVSSTLWHLIDSVSRDSKHRFRHDVVFRGVCLERCIRSLNDTSAGALKRYEGRGVQDEQLSTYFMQVHRRASDADDRRLYSELVNNCLNLEFSQKFSLQVSSQIEYCVSADDHLELDALDLTAYTVGFIIVLLTLCSSIYDYCLSNRDPCQLAENFYRKHLKTRKQQFLTSFSLPRNYYRLAKPHNTDFANDLSFFDGFRIIGVFIVILGHVLMVFMTTAIENPEYYEQFIYSFWSSITQNGHVAIQIFFVMSGFLLYVDFTERQLVSPKSDTLQCIAVYFRLFFYRYFRLIPSVLALILFNGTVLVRLQDGPFWRHVTEPERVFCRTNWWKNVFFVTNHMMEYSCSHQTWYLGADMQLFELFLIVIIISKKHPRLVKPIYITLMALAVAVPAILTYALKLDAVYHTTPETYRFLFFRHSDTFYQIYPTFYANLSGYLFGFICGHLYLSQRSKATILRGQLKYKLAMWLLISAGLVILSSGYIFIYFDFAKPSIWLAVYAGLYKNLWVLICAGFVFLMSCKMGGIAYRFCTLPVFRPLARTSFQAYLWHVVVLRVVTGYFRQPSHVSTVFLRVCCVAICCVFNGPAAGISSRRGSALPVETPYKQK